MDEVIDLLDATSPRGRIPVGRPVDATERGRLTQPGARRPAPEMVNESHSAQPREWRVRCQDVIDRERCLTVLVTEGRVVIVGPPGETAILTSGQLGQFRTALREAAELAER